MYGLSGRRESGVLPEHSLLHLSSQTRLTCEGSLTVITRYKHRLAGERDRPLPFRGHVEGCGTPTPNCLISLSIWSHTERRVKIR